MAGGNYDCDIRWRLSRAVWSGRIEETRELIDSYGLSYSPQWSEGYTLLVEALENGHLEIAELLLTRGSRVNENKQNISGTPLHFAVKKGYIDIVEMLLEKGANIEAKNYKGETPLFWAIDNTNIALTKLLLNHGADINGSDNHGKSVLYHAVKRGVVLIVEHLLKCGASVNCVVTEGSKKGYTPLHMAVHRDNETVCTLLLSEGADVNVKAYDDITPLHVASSSSNIPRIVEDLLRHGACTDSLTLKQGYTPLMMAIHSRNETVVKLLLQHTTNIDSQDKNGCTVLNLAVKSQNLKIVKDVLKYNPGVNNQSNRTSLKISVLFCNGNENESENIFYALLEYGLTINIEDANDKYLMHAAVKKGFLKIVEDLLKYGADVNAQDEDGKPPIFYTINNDDLKTTKLLLTNRANVTPELLNYAVERNNFHIVKALLEYDADIVYLNNNCLATALHSVSYEDSDVYAAGEIVKLLLSKGANVDAQNDHFQTPLYLSAFAGNEKVARILLNKGANVHAEDNDGFTPLHIAMQDGNTEFVELLLEYGANVDSKSRAHMTPLQLCVISGRNTTTMKILKFGAEINSRDKEGQTPLHNACKKGHEEVVNLLLDYGSDINIITTEMNHTPLDYAFDEYNNYMTSKFESIVKVMTHHIIKIKTANLHVSDKNLDSTSDNKFDDFRNECKKEIVLMKSEKINANISFYDILTKGPSSLEIYMRNENVVQALKSGNYETKFPIYATMIKNNFRQSMERNMLLELCKKELHSLFMNYPLLPYICTEKILSFLDMKDLKTLINMRPSNYYAAYCSFIKKHNYLFL